MKVNRGDVVLVDHPFSDASGSKIRPILSETIVALITKNVGRVPTDPTQLLIDIGTPAGKASGLNANSAVKCGKLLTIDEKFVRRRIGVLHAAFLKQVSDCLKAALDLH